MRLLLKTKEDLVNVYWVKANNQSVTGWHAGNYHQKELSVYNLRPDFHFNYPVSGGYHHSFKSKFSDPEFYITIFWDRVKIKTIEANGIRKVHNIPKEVFDESENNILGHMMVAYELPPISEIRAFAFPTVNFNVINGDFNSKCFDEIIDADKVRCNDIVVDVSNWDKIAVNAFGFLRKNTQSYLDFVTNPSPKDMRYIIQSEKLSNTHSLDLICSYMSNIHL